MIQVKKDLVATFTNGLGKEHNWTYKDVNADLPAPAIKEACELLTTLDIFEQDGVKLFGSVVTAKIVTTKETEIFDVKNDPKTEEKEPCEKVKSANEGVPAEPKIGPYLLTKNASQIGEISTLKYENNSASFPSVSLPTSQVSTHLSQVSGSDLKSVSTEKVNNLITEKVLQPPTQSSSEKDDVGFKRRLARLWGKKGRNKEDPS